MFTKYHIIFYLCHKFKNQFMELVVYKASAGSGKTFTLAVEYIKMLINNPRAYRQILAVTFTNKATTEMKERILSQLFGIWKSDPDSDSYLKKLMEDTGRSESEIRTAAGTALNYMLHDYSRFRVETIDSFFQSVMRNLARELELSPNLNIELNNMEVLSDSVDSMIEKLDITSATLAWLLEYINERIADDKRWNVAQEIKKFGRNIFDEGYIEKGKMLREKLKNNPGLLGAYRKELKEMQDAAIDQMAGFSDHFFQTIEENEFTEDDFKLKSKGICSYFRKLGKGKIGDDIRNPTLEDCLADAKNWVTKSAPHRLEVLDLINSELMDILINAEELRSKNNRILNSCQLSLQHLNKLQLLNNIDDEVRTLNREHNRFLLSDTNALLHELVRDGDSSFVFEKLGANIRNVMIDEFQDTSRMQWENFRLLLLEGLSQGADSLIVGDVKQSIYRWRNGDWGILNGLNKKLDYFDIRVETLQTNWRSETNIIHFNNEIFKATSDYLNTIYREELKQDCTPLISAYSDVEQQSSKKEDKGYVKIDFIEIDRKKKGDATKEDDKENDYNYQTLARMGDEVKRLLAEGVKLNDITILVRKNKNIPDIADYFDKELNCKVVSDEAFRLDASSAICMLMDALRYLSNSQDSIARASLIMNYQLQIKGYEGETNLLLTGNPEQYLPQAFVQHTEQLCLMPLYELLEELFRIFDMKCIDQQDAYLFAFFDAVTDYLQSNSSELDSFIAYWDDKMCSKTIPSGELEGIRIYSIHKSKGLEFHTVLIPFCDWKKENETNDQLVWCAPMEAPYNELDLVPVNYSSKMASSVYLNDYQKERLQLWVDSLNLLYVAFTRASKNLFVWTRKDLANSMSELLTSALPNVGKALGVDWDMVDGEPFELGELCPSTEKKEKVSTNKLTRKPEKLPIQMQSLQHDIEFRQSNKSADFIEGIDEKESDSRFINRGQLYHTLFSTIQSKADIDNAIDRLIFEGIIGENNNIDEIREYTKQAFDQPEVQDWYSDHWRMFNECAIIYMEDDELQTRRPDRVMMDDKQTIVVDFKFGQPSKKYAKQVQGYMHLLQQMGYSNLSGYLWYVDEQRIEPVSNK